MTLDEAIERARDKALKMYQNPETKNRGAEYLQIAKWLDTPYAIVVCGKKTTNISSFELDGVWAQDCVAATENLLLAAYSMGLDARGRVCWPSPTIMATVKMQVELPFGVIPFSYVTIGSPAENPQPKNKYDPKLIHYEKW